MRGKGRDIGKGSIFQKEVISIEGRPYVRFFGIEGALEFPLDPEGRPIYTSPDARIDISKLDKTNVLHTLFVSMVTSKMLLDIRFEMIDKRFARGKENKREGRAVFDSPGMA